MIPDSPIDAARTSIPASHAIRDTCAALLAAEEAGGLDARPVRSQLHSSRRPDGVEAEQARTRREEA